MAVAGGRLYLLLGRRLFSAPISATAIGAWTEYAGWDAVLPADVVDLAIAAADYTGDGRGDLVVLSTRRLPSTPGCSTSMAAIRTRALAR